MTLRPNFQQVSLLSTVPLLNPQSLLRRRWHCTVDGQARSEGCPVLLSGLKLPVTKACGDDTATGAQEAFNVAEQERAECLRLLSALQTLQNDMPGWNNETYQAGQARVTALLGNLQAQSSKMDDCLQPLTKELQQVKKTCHAKSALRRAARWSLVKGWEAFGLTKHWLNLTIEFINCQ